MSETILLHALNEVDDIYIEEAALPENPAEGKKSMRPWKIALPAAAAACLLFTAYSVFHYISNIKPNNPSVEAPDTPGTSSFNPSLASGSVSGGGTEELPLLTVGGDTDYAMGYEGYMAREASELINANPWEEGLELTTLPVWRNTLVYNENTMTPTGDFHIMKQLLTDTAARLGMDTDTLEIRDNTPSAEEQEQIRKKLEQVDGQVPEGYFDPTAVFAEENGVRVTVDTSMTVEIRFDPAVSLPPEYDFTHYASYEDTAAVAEYLKETRRDLIGMENPRTNICGGDYDIYNRQSYHIEFFEGAENLTDRIVNYNFRRAAFYCNDDGALFLARIFSTDLSDKAGDYPVISAEEAKELLIGGHYITSVPFEMPGEEYVAKVELIYRSGNREQYFMPYYRFLVELPEMEREGGMKDYGAYYVPAVESRYIENMPLWDGSFN